jgi:hypothetical protein
MNPTSLLLPAKLRTSILSEEYLNFYVLTITYLKEIPGNKINFELHITGTL